jgi:hypothetical protein
VAVVAAIGYRRRPWGDSEAGTPSDAPGATAGESAAGADQSDVSEGAAPAGAAATSAADDGAGSDGQDGQPESDADGTDGEVDADGEDDAEGEPAPPIDDDLLSNEEQVLRLVEANGGRMKQKQVAEELDWTAAKTSQVVTGLRDEGDLDGFRLGRENVLSLPEYDATTDNGGSDGDDGDDEE